MTGTSYRATAGFHWETEDHPFKPATVAVATDFRTGISAGHEI
ncbi:MAG: hypothetical protein WA626_12410 [Acidobacteriaceae bacterium]